MNTPVESAESVRAANLQILQAYFRYQAEKNLDAWFELWSADGVFVIPYAPEGFPDRIAGRSQLEPLYRKLFEGYGELRYHDLYIRPLLDPNSFVATWVTDVELLAGGRYVNKLIALFELREGKIVEYVEYFDPRPFEKRLAD
jgi:ketosteroid isomerase-like protein